MGALVEIIKTQMSTHADMLAWKNLQRGTEVIITFADSAENVMAHVLLFHKDAPDVLYHGGKFHLSPGKFLDFVEPENPVLMRVLMDKETKEINELCSKLATEPCAIGPPAGIADASVQSSTGGQTSKPGVDGQSQEDFDK